jgi:hypothetical protein
MLVPLKVPPGIFRNGTNYQAAGRWYDGNLMRFFRGAIRPVGGWAKAADTMLTGKARGAHSWLGNDGNQWGAIGTNEKLYVYSGGSLYDVTPIGFTAGRQDSLAGPGYGYGEYGAGPYGITIATGSIEASTWSLDNYGQYLIACMSGDGNVYQWTLSTATPAAILTGAPTSNYGVFVTPERMVVCYGAEGVPRRVKWSDSTDTTIWTPSATNTAGSLDVESKGKFNAHLKVKGGTLLSTNADVHLMQYVGPPLIYGINKIGDSCGFIGHNAGVAVGAGAIWMGQNSFFTYDGSNVSVLPGDVDDYVFGRVNAVQSAKIICGHNPEWGEVWWFYPSGSSLENDSYVLYNYQEQHWNIGSIGRSSWISPGVFQFPLAAADDGYLYQHETGFDSDRSPITTGRFLQAGPVEITPGDRVLMLKQMIPDESTPGSVRVSFTTQFTPEGPSYSYGPYTIAPYTDVRMQGRQIATRLESVVDADWRLGLLRFDSAPGGRR